MLKQIFDSSVLTNNNWAYIHNLNWNKFCVTLTLFCVILTLFRHFDIFVHNVKLCFRIFKRLVQIIWLVFNKKKVWKYCEIRNSQNLSLWLIVEVTKSIWSLFVFVHVFIQINKILQLFLTVQFLLLKIKLK